MSLAVIADLQCDCQFVSQPKRQSEIGNRQLAMLMAERVGFEPTVRCRTQHFQCCQLSHSCTFPDCKAKGKSKKAKMWRYGFAFYLFTFSFARVAERVGFEPTVGVNPLRFSRPVH